jgi:hypothetical protein
VNDILLVLAIATVAWLYSSVGHAGASGYIAVMTLVGLTPNEIKPLALLLNILVASIASVQFYRGGHFSWKLFWPFALLATPLAFVGGAVRLPLDLFSILLGAVLGASALWLLKPLPENEQIQHPSIPASLTTGAGIGLLSGLTGTGGGIYLTPLLLWMRWATTKTASAVSAVFILLNSLAGFAGAMTSNTQVPNHLLPLALAAILGGSIGATLGSFRLPVRSARTLLAIVMFIASAKLLIT